MKSVFTVTGKDLEAFVEQWVYESGCAYFNGSFAFNRKRNVVELELKQDLSGKGVHRYVVSMLARLVVNYLGNVSVKLNKTLF